MKVRNGLFLFVLWSLSFGLIATDAKELTKDKIQEILELYHTKTNENKADIDDAGSIESYNDTIELSVIKIHSKFNEYDLAKPWKSPDQNACSGSGFVIKTKSGLKILTNAHVVADTSFLQVTRPDVAKKFFAEVEFISHPCDLAILKVIEQEEFYENLVPMQFAEGITRKREEVEVYGYPTAGDTLSVSGGKASRTEVQEYAHSGQELLCTQTDAAINPGNSGGPVINLAGEVVGVAFQGVGELQNTAFFIPVPIIQHFLAEVDRGEILGFPDLGVEFQELESKALRNFYQVPTRKSGMLVTSIETNSPAQGILKVGDVVTTIDGKSIENDMKFSLRNKLRIESTHLISCKYIGDTLNFKILRNGEEIDLETSLPYDNKAYELGRSNSYDLKPEYYIHGGLVFQPFSQDCINKSASILMIRDLQQDKKSLDHELVLLNQVLAAEINDGYHHLSGMIVKSVNGVEIKNLRELISALEKNEKEFHEIILKNKTQIILDKDLALADHNKILDQYSIPFDRSVHYR